MSIFRAYDIRGIYNEDLTVDLAREIGKAYITLMKDDEAVIGEDCRVSSPFLAKAIIEGMNAAGADVYNIDMVPGPLVPFALAINKKEAGVYVSASHNPPEYNGFKLMRGVKSLTSEEIRSIERMIKGRNYRIGNGAVYRREIIGKYKEFVENKVEVKGLKVVIDSANGTCGVVAPQIFKDLGCYVTELYSEPDGRFPNHMPDPTRPENLVEIKRRVVEDQANLGIAFDGDGDRVVFIDERGNDIRGDQALMIFARKILNKTKGKIIFTANCSKAVEEDVKAHGGIPLINEVGHSYVKKRLFEEDALLAGEMSGHFFFKDDYFGFDDGIYAALRMAEIVREEKLSLMVSSLPKYYSTQEYRLPCPDNKKFKVIEQLKKEFANYELITIDGVRIEFENGWGLVRASNTEPVISARFEATTEKERDAIKERVMGALKRLGVR